MAERALCPPGSDRSSHLASQSRRERLNWDGAGWAPCRCMSCIPYRDCSRDLRILRGVCPAHVTGMMYLQPLHATGASVQSASARGTRPRQLCLNKGRQTDDRDPSRHRQAHHVKGSAPLLASINADVQVSSASRRRRSAQCRPCHRRQCMAECHRTHECEQRH